MDISEVQHLESGHSTQTGETVVRPGGTRPILRDLPPPHNDAGRDEFYIAWWTRGCCFENCCRSNAHVPFTNETERTRLLMFCREYIAAPTGGGGPVAPDEQARRMPSRNRTRGRNPPGY